MAARSRSTTLRAVVCGLVMFAVVDVGVFRSGAWAFFAKPDSSGGWVALRTALDPLLSPVPESPSILLIGDSRMTEVCSAEAMEAEIGTPRITVRDGSMPGSTPRVWPWLLRNLLDRGQRWSVVVVGLSTFDDDGDLEPMADRALDLAFVNPLSRIADVPEIAASYREVDAKRDAWLGALVKSYAWRHDQRDALARPWQRYLDLRHQYGSRRWGPYRGNDGSLAGVSIDGDRIVGLPPEKEAMAVTLRHLVHPPGPSPDNSAYRRQWLGRLVDLAAAHGATVVFVRLPTRVLWPATPRPPRENVLDELRQRPNVKVIDREFATAFERPEFFHDPVHVNRAGRERFSPLLAKTLLREFGALLGR